MKLNNGRQLGVLPRILFVDEGIMLRRQIGLSLARDGYEVDAVENGAAAWEVLQTKEYDLMITDNSMSSISGIALVKMLRGRSSTLPVIMATGSIPMEELKTHPWLGISAILVKPYTTEELLKTIKRILHEPGVSAAHSQLRNNTSCGLGKSAYSILVADPDSDIRLMYADALMRPGFNVDFAEDGMAAWEALQRNRYNLLITESALPALSGLELVTRLRSARMDFPVVMAAGRLPSQELARSPNMQLAATLLKPFSLDALVETVRTVLRDAVPSVLLELVFSTRPYPQAQFADGSAISEKQFSRPGAAYP